MQRVVVVFLALLFLSTVVRPGSAGERPDPVVALLKKLNAGMRAEPLSPDTVKLIFQAMRDRSEHMDKALAAIPALMFQDTYDPHLADLVIALPDREGGKPAIALVQGGGSSRELFGQRTIWAMVFWKKVRKDIEVEAADTMIAVGDRDLGKITEVRKASADGPAGTRDEISANLIKQLTTSSWPYARPGTEIHRSIGLTSSDGSIDSASFRLEPLVYEEESVDRSLVGGLLSLVKLGENKEPEKVDDEEGNAKVTSLGHFEADTLMFAMKKFKIRDNSVNRIRAQVDSRKAYATFGNYEASFYGISVGFNANKEYSSDSTWALVTKPFVYLHLYAKRPRLPKLAQKGPLYASSLRLTLGTEISTKFERWYGGVGIGNLVGRLGITAGLRMNVKQREPRLGRLFAFGIDYTL